jgi:hypothetical protein
MTTRTNPQEDWLHGIARVHEKMKHLENCMLLRQAFAMNENDFTMHPVQLPFKNTRISLAGIAVSWYNKFRRK